MNIYDQIVQNQKQFSEGKINYIPHPPEMGDFTKWFPGRMRGDYTAITGGTSSMKTTLAKFLVFRAVGWAIKENIDYKVAWFAFEESQQQFFYSLLSFLLYREKGLRYNIENFEGLGKTVEEKDLPAIQEIMPLFEKYKSYFRVYDTIYNSFGIYKTVRDLASKRGKFFLGGKEINYEEIHDKGWDKYVPDNPEEYIEIVLDHVGILTPQTGEKDLADAITNLSKNMRQYVSKLLNYSVVWVQQQMMEMENLDHIKENQIYPSIQGLGDNKRVGRDMLNIIGICNPNRFGIRIANTDSGSFNIGELKDYQRVINILKRRYGVVNKKTCLYADGCCGWFEPIPSAGSEGYKKLTEKIKSYG